MGARKCSFDIVMPAFPCPFTEECLFMSYRLMGGIVCVSGRVRVGGD